MKKVVDFWKLMKPIIIVVLAVFGYFFAENGISRNLFLAIVILSFIFRGEDIVKGFVNIFKNIKKK